MDEPEIIYANVDIAQELSISPQALANHQRRRDDTPAPRYVTRSGRPHWSIDDLPAWYAWREKVTIRGRRPVDSQE